MGSHCSIVGPIDTYNVTKRIAIMYSGIHSSYHTIPVYFLQPIKTWASIAATKLENSRDSRHLILHRKRHGIARPDQAKQMRY